MKQYPAKFFTGFVQLLNGDTSIETARLLVGEFGPSFSPVEQDTMRLQTFIPMVKHLDTLRGMVDQWNDSGINPEDGSETPTSRHLDNDGVFFKPAEVESVLDEGRLVSVIKQGSRIRQIVAACLERHPARISLADGGGIQVLGCPPQEIPEGAIPDSEQAPMPETHVALLFIRFFDSPWIFRLMRCTRCRTYQLVNAPRQSYVRGWHCAECRKTAAATRCVSKARANERERRLQACAAAWAKDEPKHADRCAWVLEQANKQFEYGDLIKRNFIARNRAEIQDRAERMSNAKG